VDWNRHDSTKRRRPGFATSFLGRDYLDIRARSSNEPAIVSDDHPIRALMAPHHHDSDDGPEPVALTANADQHPR
jgi:hypothetical protein